MQRKYKSKRINSINNETNTNKRSSSNSSESNHQTKADNDCVKKNVKDGRVCNLSSGAEASTSLTSSSSSSSSSCLSSPPITKLRPQQTARSSSTANEIFKNLESSSSGVSSSTLNSASAQRIKAPLFHLKVPQEETIHQGKHSKHQNKTTFKDDANPLESEMQINQCHWGTAKNKQAYETEIIRLNTQLDEHKLKEMELYNERDKLNKLNDNYKKMNQVG